MRAKLVGAMVICAAASLVPTTALAGGFTRPVRLPSDGEEWVFAVNDRGQALAASGDLVYPVGRSGRLGRPWKVTVPGGFEADVGSLALDDRGRVAAGLVYGDGSVPRGEGEHGSPGCCEHVAVVSWRLGTQPPVAQVLESPGQSYFYDTESVAPRVVVGPRAVTALWRDPAGPQGYGPEGEPEAQLYEAFGPFASALRTRMMVSVPHGVQSVHLALDRTGDPIAAWRDDLRMLHSVRGLPSGALPRSSQAVPIPGVKNDEPETEFAQGNEFSSDPQGDTVFAYVPGAFERESNVMAMTSVDGRVFDAPRTIAHTGREHDRVVVVAGGNRSLLVFTSCLANVRECSPVLGRRANIFGSHQLPFGVGREPQAFVDSSGRSVIAFDGESTVEAITAEPEGAFGHRQPISPAGCQLGTGSDDEPPPASSQSGAAIFYFTCGGYDHQYLARYTP